MPVVITNEHKNYYGSNYNRYSNQFYASECFTLEPVQYFWGNSLVKQKILKSTLLQI